MHATWGSGLLGVCKVGSHSNFAVMASEWKASNLIPWKDFLIALCQLRYRAVLIFQAISALGQLSKAPITSVSLRGRKVLAAFWYDCAHLLGET